MTVRIVLGKLAALAITCAPALALADEAARGDLRAFERREVVIPIPGGERIQIDNPLGRVQVRAWDRSGEIHVVADKRSGTAEGLGRLRVHYTAWEVGEVQIDVRVDAAGTARALPLAKSQVDLLIEVPPHLQVSAKTFGGDVSASGLRAGARLETTGGRIGVSNVSGGVVTRQLRGGQTVVSVRGDVDIDGIDGDLDLRELGGGHVDARMVGGNIRAEGVQAEWVRLRTVMGEIFLAGALRPGGTYELRSHAGRIRLVPNELPAIAEIRSRSPWPIESPLPLRILAREGKAVRSLYTRTPGLAPAQGVGEADARAVVELVSALGRVSIEALATSPR